MYPDEGKSVAEAASRGTERELLIAMRARIAEAVESPTTPARDLAALTKRLMEVVRDIKAIDARAAEQEAERDNAASDEAFDPSAI
ncbi:hypothetical protein AB0H43_02960 [Hamadaea sp. NPDC050747]|uniref:hypothetical protein n=1 Tax=Hamadaea sp. NPDC050747 TaxID=3155789 RepID=UPI0033CEDE2C